MPYSLIMKTTMRSAIAAWMNDGHIFAGEALKIEHCANGGQCWVTDANGRGIKLYGSPKAATIVTERA